MHLSGGTVSSHANPPVELLLQVRITYPGFKLDVDHRVLLQGITGLFGASGGGKSTLLRIIAGFEKTARGKISFDGDAWQDSSRRQFLPSHRRPVGFVFQDTRLFDHLDVAGNLAFAAQRHKLKQSSIGQQEVLSAFDLQGLLSRRVTGLSGGERQRIAIARTLLTQPRILLLDEPLAALDRGRKSEILPYLESLPQRFGIPVIYVSHSVDEVARLCDRVIALQDGHIAAVGGAADVLNHLDEHATRLSTELFTVLEAKVIEQLTDVQLTRLDHAGQTFVVPMLTHLPNGTDVRLNVRASDVAIATEAPRNLSFRNVLRGTLSGIESRPDSPFATALVDIGGGTTVRAQLTRHAVAELNLRAGMPVFALLKTASFDRQS